LSTVTATAEKAPLDEVMLAMDVVDTLRHRQDLVERELMGDAREKQLLERLRDIYHQQGIEVTDDVLRAGVKALAESRFTYTPPKPSLSTNLARAYVSRKKWGPATLAIVLVVVVGLGGYFLAWQPFQAAQAEAARIELSQGLPAQMDALYQTIYEETKVQQAVTTADTIRTRGKGLAAEGNRAGAQQAITDLTALRDRLRSEYTLKIVSREGERSAFWRVPDANPDATNYYIIVQAVGTDGKPVALPVTNEETGAVETVDTWGARVPESTYRSVENDKRDDGIIQRSTLGLKEYGFLDPDYVMPVLGGAVTKW
jgi:hypothetical protein